MKRSFTIFCATICTVFVLALLASTNTHGATTTLRAFSQFPTPDDGGGNIVARSQFPTPDDGGGNIVARSQFPTPDDGGGNISQFPTPDDGGGNFRTV
jgi:hypothetical protein